MSQKISLTASVVVPAGGKATMVMVKFGPVLVAKATLGGRWNEQQAIGELRKQPKRFTLVGDDARTILASQGIAA
jgi:hypothetical protein